MNVHVIHIHIVNIFSNIYTYANSNARVRANSVTLTGANSRRNSIKIPSTKGNPFYIDVQ
jgi:hypothetical protein